MSRRSPELVEWGDGECRRFRDGFPHAKVAKDAKGVWWGNGIAQPDTAGLESVGVWGKWNGSAWVGQIADTSTENAAAAYFPADVLAQLAL